MRLQSYTWNATNLPGPEQSPLVGHLLTLDLRPYLLPTLRVPKIQRWGTRSRWLIEIEIDILAEGNVRWEHENAHTRSSVYISKCISDIIFSLRAKKTNVSVPSRNGLRRRELFRSSQKFRDRGLEIEVSVEIVRFQKKDVGTMPYDLSNTKARAKFDQNGISYMAETAIIFCASSGVMFPFPLFHLGPYSRWMAL